MESKLIQQNKKLLNMKILARFTNSVQMLNSGNGNVKEKEEQTTE